MIRQQPTAATNWSALQLGVSCIGFLFVWFVCILTIKVSNGTIDQRQARNRNSSQSHPNLIARLELKAAKSRQEWSVYVIDKGPVYVVTYRSKFSLGIFPIEKLIFVSEIN